MARIGESADLLKCSFCGKSQKQVQQLIAGPGVYICDECVELCNDIIREESKAGLAGKKDGGVPTPQEILNLKKRLNEIYVKHTGQTFKALEDALERDRFMSAEAAREYGLIDAVLDRRGVESVKSA